MAHIGVYSCLVLVILGSLQLGNVHALKCYQITPPATTAEEKVCDSNLNTCIKTVASAGSTSVVGKGCFVTPANTEMKCTPVTQGGATTETCYCNTDLCNSAGKTGAFSLLSFGVAAAVLYRLF